MSNGNDDAPFFVILFTCFLSLQKHNTNREKRTRIVMILVLFVIFEEHLKLLLSLKNDLPSNGPASFKKILSMMNPLPATWVIIEPKHIHCPRHIRANLLHALQRIADVGTQAHQVAVD